MSENIAIVFAVIGFYPLVVLLVALSGPHSRYERPTPTHRKGE